MHSSIGPLMRNLISHVSLTPVSSWGEIGVGFSQLPVDGERLGDMLEEKKKVVG